MARKNAPTDVISLEWERLMIRFGSGEMCELGDIILAPNFIARQAKNMALRRQMSLGSCCSCHASPARYEPVEDDEAEVMEAREDALVALLSTDRTIGPVCVDSPPWGD